MFDAEAGREGASVIVVEDNEDDASLTLRGLRAVQPKPQVDLIVDGASALRRLTETSDQLPELVFLDLKLPKVHGLDVLAGLRSAETGKDIKVVVFTSSDEPRDVSRATELGCTAYLKKPIDWDEYIKLVCRTASQLLPHANCFD